VRIASPSHTEIVDSLGRVAKLEGLSPSNELLHNIASASDGNLRKALLSFEASIRKFGVAGVAIEKLDWETHVEAISRLVIQEQSPANLLAVRSKLYELITHCIPSPVIIKSIMNALVKDLKFSEKARGIVEACAFYVNFNNHITF
jgi:replication factor C subunit 3/5